jgi:hypothetical protein
MKVVLLIGLMTSLSGMLLVAFGILAQSMPMNLLVLSALAFSVFSCFFVSELTKD